MEKKEKEKKKKKKNSDEKYTILMTYKIMKMRKKAIVGNDDNDS